MDGKEAPGKSAVKGTHREVRGAEGQGDREKPYSEGRVSQRGRAVKRGHIREQREHKGVLSKQEKGRNRIPQPTLQQDEGNEGRAEVGTWTADSGRSSCWTEKAPSRGKSGSGRNQNDSWFWA